MPTERDILLNVIVDELFGLMLDDGTVGERFTREVAENLSQVEEETLKIAWAKYLDGLWPDVDTSISTAAQTQLREIYIDFLPWWTDPLRLMRLVSRLFGFGYYRIKAKSPLEAILRLALKLNERGNNGQ